MIKNPILRGFNPDPCICRKGKDYYIAVSSFEWFPAVPVYHSRDLKNWELLTHLLTDEKQINLSRLRTGQGIWAPCLSYCEQDGLFYLVYGCMVPNGMNIDNYLITAEDIRGPWSEPVYLHSSGFDASLFHDDDGKKWLLSLEWERREGYTRPGAICIAEYSPGEKRILDYPERIWYGGTKRGWVEGPHMYKHNGMYYLLCAEGGTGYHHCVSVGRSGSVRGPFERDTRNPVITSSLDKDEEVRTKASEDYKFYNPEVRLQKAGHASLVETPEGKWYAAHLCARPFVPELRCVMGRETAIQEMEWTQDGWIRKKNGSPFPEDECEGGGIAKAPVRRMPERDEFDEPELGLGYYAPRHMPDTFADTGARKGYVRLRGQEVLDSFDRVSVLTRKLTSVYMVLTTRMEFTPKVHQHTAGIVLYYDNLNYLYLRKYYSDTLKQSALSIVHAEKGTVKELTQTRTPVTEGAINLRLVIDGKETYFEWSCEGDWRRIGGKFDTTRFSDEFCGEFTGTMAGIVCTDGVFRKNYADFDYFELIDLEGENDD